MCQGACVSARGPGVLPLTRAPAPFAQHNTMESLLERGEKIDDLVSKSEVLGIHSKAFYKTVGAPAPGPPGPGPPAASRGLPRRSGVMGEVACGVATSEQEARGPWGQGWAALFGGERGQLDPSRSWCPAPSWWQERVWGKWSWL